MSELWDGRSLLAPKKCQDQSGDSGCIYIYTHTHMDYDSEEF